MIKAAAVLTECQPKMKRYSLTLTGDLLPGADRAAAVVSLAATLKLPSVQAGSLLDGRPRRLKGVLSQEQAERGRAGFERIGVGCLIREESDGSLEPALAADAFRRPSGLSVALPTVRCPNCGAEQPPGELCQHCGIAFAKFGRTATPRRAIALAVRAETSRFPFKLLRLTLLLIFLWSLALALWSHWKKDQLPPPVFYDAARLGEPLQTPTAAGPFRVEAKGIVYTIEPLYDYQLDGVVVSLHDSDVFWDIYHFKDWKDFINIRDLCVVWGDNVTTGAFRAMSYSNTTWTCWVSTRDGASAGAFAMNQLSNNHLLTQDPVIQRVLKSAEIGDQVRFTGKLARYSHAGGFQRGTSTTRTDQGNGACETVYLEAFEITRKANTGWRLVYRASVTTALLALLALTVAFFVAPVRGLRGS